MFIEKLYANISKIMVSKIKPIETQTYRKTNKRADKYKEKFGNITQHSFVHIVYSVCRILLYK